MDVDEESDQNLGLSLATVHFKGDSWAYAISTTSNVHAQMH